MNGVALLSYDKRSSNQSQAPSKTWMRLKNISLLLHAFPLGLVKALGQSSNSLLRLFWFRHPSCSPVTARSPLLLYSLSKVTSKRTCQHSLPVWHECQRTTRGCRWGDTISGDSWYVKLLHAFKKSSENALIRKQVPGPNLSIKNTLTKKLWPGTLITSVAGQT